LKAKSGKDLKLVTTLRVLFVFDAVEYITTHEDDAERRKP